MYHRNKALAANKLCFAEFTVRGLSMCLNIFFSRFKYAAKVRAVGLGGASVESLRRLGF